MKNANVVAVDPLDEFASEADAMPPAPYVSRPDPLFSFVEREPHQPVRLAGIVICVALILAAVFGAYLVGQRLL